MADSSIQDWDGSPTADVVTESGANLANQDMSGGQNIYTNTTDKWPTAIATLMVTGFGADPSGGAVDLYCMKGNIGNASEDEDTDEKDWADAITATSGTAFVEGMHYLGSYHFNSSTGLQRKAINISLYGIKEAYFYVFNDTGTTMTQPYTVDIEGITYTPSA